MKLSDFPEIILATSKVSDKNLSFVQGDQKEVLENRKKFLNSNKISLDNTTVLHVQHGIKVVRVKKSDLGKGVFDLESALKVDALITNEPGINLFLLTADCLPISLYDPGNKAIGLIHAGWKGLDLEIINKTIKMMLAKFGTKPNNLVALIGPSIGPCCYKNSPTFIQKNDPKWQSFIKLENNNFILDLWSFAENQLKEARVLSENIENPKICTYHSSEYFSHRKADDEKLPHDYRFATIIGIKK